MIREITSASNPLVKELRALVNSKKTRQQSGTFIIEGRRGIETLVAHASGAYRLEKLVLSNDCPARRSLPDHHDCSVADDVKKEKDKAFFQALEKKFQGLEIVTVPDFIFKKISDVKHAPGILGVVRHIPIPFTVKPGNGYYLLLDSISDPGNLGTLIRSAVAAGFDGVLLYGNCVEYTNPKVIRATMGTFPAIGIWHIEKAEIFQFLENGYELVATAVKDGENLYETEFTPKTILVIGNEAHGVSPDIIELAQKKITIPIKPACESLNAAVAGSICMFQIVNGLSARHRS